MTGSRRGLLLLLLGLAAFTASACAGRPVEQASAPTRAAAPDLQSFALGPSYAVEFSAANDTCRGYTFSHEGRARLRTDAGTSTLELEVESINPFAGMNIKFSPPPDPDPEPTRCRWSGAGEPSTDGVILHLSLEPGDDACGDPTPLELQCRPDTAALPNANGVTATTPLLRCRALSELPTALWVLSDLITKELVLSSAGLRSELRTATFNGTSVTLLRAP